MKPRRLLSSVPQLPTITETHEDASPRPPVCPAHSLDDYVSSIKELAQPGAYPGYGPVRVPRSQRPRFFSKTLGKHLASSSTSSSSPRCSVRGAWSRPVAGGRDDFSLRWSGQMGCGYADPLDWLYAQAQTHGEDVRRRESAPAALQLL